MTDERRIAACLKACEGLDTELLETSMSPGGAIRFLQSQRNELRAALEGLVLFTKPKPFSAVALHNAHQAIASVITDGGFSQHPAVAQRDELLAALRAIKQEVFYGIKDGAAERIDAIATPAIAKAKGSSS